MLTATLICEGLLILTGREGRKWSEGGEEGGKQDEDRKEGAAQDGVGLRAKPSETNGWYRKENTQTQRQQLLSMQVLSFVLPWTLLHIDPVYPST